MKSDAGVYVVPATLNGAVTVNCIVDSGASDVNIPDDVFRRMARIGAIKESDFVGMREYELADGSSVKGKVFRIRVLRVGSIEVRDVLASVGGDGETGLLGQSFLSRFKSWSVDNGRRALMLVGAPSAPPATPTPTVVRSRPAKPGNDTVAQTSSGNAARDGAQARDDDGAPLTAQTGH